MVNNNLENDTVDLKTWFCRKICLASCYLVEKNLDFKNGTILSSLLICFK